MYNYNVNKDPVYLKQPTKYLEKAQPWQVKAIKRAVKDLPDGDVEYFPSERMYRLRVGGYRIKFAVIKDRVFVHKIRPRGDVYKGAK